MADDFDNPKMNADSCSFNLTLPSLDFKFLPPIPALIIPPFPIPLPAFELVCDLSKPISVTSGVKSGGGRNTKYDTDPDSEDT